MVCSETLAGPTDKVVQDDAYRVHFANASQHTDGCIGLRNLEDLLRLKTTPTGIPISLEVTG